MLEETKRISNLDQMVSEGVDLAVINVIEQSVQCLLEGTDQPTVGLVAPLSHVLEESLHGLIKECSIDNEVYKLFNHSAGAYPFSVRLVSNGHYCDSTNLDEDRSSVSMDKREVTENKKLDKWKEAGLALRKALCQFGNCSPSDENTSSNLQSSLQDVNSVCSQNCAEVKHVVGDFSVKSCIDTDKESCEKNNAVLRLAKSMEQSFIWSHEQDAMNEMWAEYENHNALICHQSPSDCENFTILNTCGCSDNTNPVTPAVVTSDPSLAELRQRMRTLVSALPIAANQVSRAVSGSLNAESTGHSSTLSASELNTPHSPKTARKRHRKVEKIPVILSEDESETCVRHYPPKLCRVKAKHNFKNAACTKCHEKSVSIPLGCHCVPDNTAKLEIEADKIYSSSLNKNTIKHFQEGKECDGKSPDSERWCTDVDDEVVTSGMKQTESVANLADVESGESELEKQILIQERFPCVQSPELHDRRIYNDDNMCNKGLREDASSISSLDIDSLDNYSDELEYFELPDFTTLFDSVSDNGEDLDLTLCYNDMKSLQTITLTDKFQSSCLDHHNIKTAILLEALNQLTHKQSSSDAEAGVEADDEFECDCLLCQCPRDIKYQNNQGTSLPEAGEINSRYSDISDTFLSFGSDADDEEASADDSSVTSTNPLSVRPSDGRDVLDLMLTNVIMHMLSVYPDLLNDCTAPPVPDSVFKSFTVISVTQCFMDSESSCPICLCKFELGEEMKQLPCTHTFHPLCIQAWVQKAGTCPVCRRNLVLPFRETHS